MTPQDKKRKTIVRLVIASILTLGLFGLVILMALVELPAGSADIVKVLVGAMGGAFVTMIAYYFGDSEGSTDNVKDE